MHDLKNLKHTEEYRCANSNNDVYIFDTAAFLSSLQLYVYKGEIITTSSVVQEVKDSESVFRLEIASIIKRFKVETPSTEFIEIARLIAKKMGLLDKLSQTDIEVLALAIQYRDRGFKPIVLTDDYDVQKILKALKIAFKPVKSIGIDKR